LRCCSVKAAARRRAAITRQLGRMPRATSCTYACGRGGGVFTTEHSFAAHTAWHPPAHLHVVSRSLICLQVVEEEATDAAVLLARRDVKVPVAAGAGCVSLALTAELTHPTP
jgi:hypothetical protein